MIVAFVATVSVMFTHINGNACGRLFVTFHHCNRTPRDFFIRQALFFEFESNPALVKTNASGIRTFRSGLFFHRFQVALMQRFVAALAGRRLERRSHSRHEIRTKSDGIRWNGVLKRVMFFAATHRQHQRE